MQLILEEMNAVQERIQKDVAHQTELKVETEGTLKKIKEERQLIDLARKVTKNTASQTENDVHSLDKTFKLSKKKKQTSQTGRTQRRKQEVTPGMNTMQQHPIRKI